MLYELVTVSGVLLQRYTRQRDAMQAACLLSLTNPSETILVQCLHLGQSAHTVCALCNGLLRPSPEVN